MADDKSPLFERYKNLIPLGSLILAIGVAIGGAVVYFSRSPEPSLRASALAFDYETPLAEGTEHEALLRSCTKFIKIDVKNNGRILAEDVRIIFDGNNFFYAIKKDDNATQATDSKISLGNLELKGHVQVRVWGDKTLNERNITIAHGKDSYSINAIRELIPNRGVFNTVLDLVGTVVMIYAAYLLVSRHRLRSKAREERKQKRLNRERQPAHSADID